MFTAESADTFARLAANHLWQSTAFAAIVALLALALKGDNMRARARVVVGGVVEVSGSVRGAGGGRRQVGTVGCACNAGIARAGGDGARSSSRSLRFRMFPFDWQPPRRLRGTGSCFPTVLLALWLCGFAAVLIYGWVRWRRVAVAIRAAQPCVAGREFEAWQRVQKKADGPRKAPGTPVRPTKTGVALQWSGPPGLLSVVSSSASWSPASSASSARSCGYPPASESASTTRSWRPSWRTNCATSAAATI